MSENQSYFASPSIFYSLMTSFSSFLLANLVSQPQNMMSNNYSWLLLISFRVIFCQLTDNYSDEDRPYKFGFNIQGYQHRREEKDVRGLIKGEYGFITADGYYRVTVYATDEDGDFKILSMKNYYVGFPPEDPTTTPLSPPKRPGKAAAPNSKFSFGKFSREEEKKLRVNENAQKPFTKPSGLPACSGCSIPITTKKPNFASDFQSKSIEKAGFGKTKTGKNEVVRRPIGKERNQNYPEKRNQNSKQEPASKIQNHSRDVVSERLPLLDNEQGPIKKYNSNLFVHNVAPVKPELPIGGIKTTREREMEELERKAKVGQMREGLLTGVSEVKNVFYKFNYTIGFHGHHEYGYRSGSKEGGYFFDGRDGTERQVRYEANEFGYQPNITFVELAENDERRPKEETEKSYGLKGYEFKWFYRR